MRRGLLVGVGAIGCGASAASPVTPVMEPESPAHHAKIDRPASDDPAPRPPGQCDDGSCFACGEAVCMSGFYCAASRSGHGCAWLPSCTGKVTCACLAEARRNEAGCACEEKRGGVFVTCDGVRL